MSAEIIQFVPKANPNRMTVEQAQEFEDKLSAQRLACLPDFPTDCGNAIWPWPEKDGA